MEAAEAAGISERTGWIMVFIDDRWLSNLEICGSDETLPSEWPDAGTSTNFERYPMPP